MIMLEKIRWDRGPNEHTVDHLSYFGLVWESPIPLSYCDSVTTL
jgi:hypothetical protein